LIFGLEFTILNKFEKEQKVIELHSKEGKTLKEIAKIVKMSFLDISKIIKAYERKITLQAKRKEK
jgi:DNA-directed RNA polymerase specialized sigma subunit